VYRQQVVKDNKERRRMHRVINDTLTSNADIKEWMDDKPVAFLEIVSELVFGHAAITKEDEKDATVLTPQKFATVLLHMTILAAYDGEDCASTKEKRYHIISNSFAHTHAFTPSRLELVNKTLTNCEDDYEQNKCGIGNSLFKDVRNNSVVQGTHAQQLLMSHPFSPHRGTKSNPENDGEPAGRHEAQRGTTHWYTLHN
jgi:hypothetical protein